jgi:hypothetical protein
MTRALVLGVLFAAAAPAWAQKPDAATEALRIEVVFWESVRASTDPADFRAYLERYPNGQFAPLARNRIAALTQKPAAPAVVPAAPPRAAAPGALAVGDTWTYRVTRGGSPRANQQIKLASVSPQLIVEEISGDGPMLRAEHRRGAYLAPAGELSAFSPYLAALMPLTPGATMRPDNLDPRTCNAGWTCSLRATVFGTERVQVEAGTFDAMRVDVLQGWTAPSQTNDRGESVTRRMTVWYAPEVKRAVKVVSRGTQSRSVDTQFELELLRYELQ